MPENIEYISPSALEIVDDSVIHERMLAILPADIDKTQGGFAYDYTMPAAIEKSNMMYDLNEAIQLYFPAWSYGVFLEQLAREVGITRRPATVSYGYLTVTGAEGKILPAGFLFATPSIDNEENIEFEIVDAITIGATETAQVYVRCTQTGPVGNVPPGSITLMVSPTGGIMEITNALAFTGGTEEEDDDELRERIRARDLSSESSYVGNESDFLRWAQEVPGVGDVVVIPEWQGVGTGTVKLVIMDSNGDPANAEILEAVVERIMSPGTPAARLAPLDTILTVVTATPLPLNIAATVEIGPDYVLAVVQAAFEAGLRTYFTEAKAEGSIRYTKIGSILSETEGMVDYSGLTLNTGTANIDIASDEYPTFGMITLTEAV